MPLLQFQNVDYSVGGPLLLEQVTLSIEPNERVCIVGRNGAGKSTLMRLIAGDITPDDGEIRVQGGVVVAAQDLMADGVARPLLFDIAKDGKLTAYEAPENELRALRGYVGSVAIDASGAFVACACLTSFTTCASAVSRPTRVAFMTIAPFPFTVAPRLRAGP